MPTGLPSTDQPSRLLDGRNDRAGGTDPGRLLPAPGPGRAEELRPIAAKAESVIHIFLPGGMAHQETFDPKPLRPDRIPRRDGLDPDEDPRRSRSARRCRRRPQIADKITVIRSMTHGEAAHERGTHNMFTGYRPSPALQFPEHGQRGQPRVRPAEQPAAVRLHSQPAERVTPAPATSARRSRRSAWAAIRPTGGFTVRDLNLPGGVDEARFDRRRIVPGSGQRPLRQEGKGRHARGDGHVLRAGLQPDQLAEGPRGVQHRRRAGRDPRRIRPQRGRPADADGPPAGGGRRAVRHR